MRRKNIPTRATSQMDPPTSAKKITPRNRSITDDARRDGCRESDDGHDPEGDPQERQEHVERTHHRHAFASPPTRETRESTSPGVTGRDTTSSARCCPF